MQPSARPRPVEILLVEDNPGDQRLTREALRDGKVLNRLHVVADGTEALRFLRREGPHGAAPRPDLILLDLNLPGMDGREVLRQVKQDDELRRIPVVVMTSSDAERDVIATYDTGANSYVTKPVGLDEFTRVVQSVQEFWFSIVTLPPE